jgi:hypothetical protein
MQGIGVWGDDKKRTVWYRRERNNPWVRRHIYEGESQCKTTTTQVKRLFNLF